MHLEFRLHVLASGVSDPVVYVDAVPWSEILILPSFTHCQQFAIEDFAQVANVEHRGVPLSSEDGTT